MRYEANIPEGQHLGNSSKDSGAQSGLLFDDETGELRGHATWRRVDDAEPVEGPWGDPLLGGQQDTRTQEKRDADAELAGRLAELVVVLAIKGAIAATPHVKRYWGTTLLPRLKELRQRLAAFRLPRFTLGATRAKRALELEAASEIVGSQLTVLEAEPALVMTKAEWDTRLRAMLAMEAFRDTQFDILRRATVVDPKLIIAGEDSDERLTPRELAGHLQRALGSNHEALDESLIVALVEALRRHEQASERRRQIGRIDR
ncbi:hypothetical protein [Isoptericola sp. NPDC058082]|uniref:hypothetical protein n=1 Tax=Isoptericola sp. NPDC058082 TaxID=3346331 RepID=UPI0036EF531F